LSICLIGNHPYQQPGQSDRQIVEQVVSRATCSVDFLEKANELGCGFLSKMVSPWPVDRFPHPALINKEFEKLKKECLK